MEKKIKELEIGFDSAGRMPEDAIGMVVAKVNEVVRELNEILHRLGG